MASLDKKTIQDLIQLCRIDCTDEEQEKLLVDMKNIFAYIEQLDEVNTDNVTPCNHVMDGVANVMRDDHVGKTLSREDFLGNAPSQVGGMIRVPPVIKQN